MIRLCVVRYSILQIRGQFFYIWFPILKFFNDTVFSWHYFSHQREKNLLLSGNSRKIMSRNWLLLTENCVSYTWFERQQHFECTTFLFLFSGLWNSIPRWTSQKLNSPNRTDSNLSPAQERIDSNCFKCQKPSFHNFLSFTTNTGAIACTIVKNCWTRTKMICIEMEQRLILVVLRKWRRIPGFESRD